MSRIELVQRICQLIGDAAEIVNAGDGWPALIRLEMSDGAHPVSLHASKVSGMGRKIPIELRFQNPADSRPVQSIGGSIPVLVGLRDARPRPVLVAADGRSRLGSTTRFSVLFHRPVVAEAAVNGWANPYVNSKGDEIHAFIPPLLPAYAEMITHGVKVAPTQIMSVVEGAGLLEDDSSGTRDRSRRATTSLVRDARFSSSVIAAYSERCSMCGLGLGLVVGAHIWPVGAPGSSDDPRNGLALCENHHRAFDSHQVWVDPRSRQIVLHPRIHEQAQEDEAARVFVKMTQHRLDEPANPKMRPREDWITRRYEYFKGNYDWVKESLRPGARTDARPKS